MNDRNQNDDKDNEDDMPQINYKDVDLDKFKHTNNKRDFSLFHLNIESLSKHTNELETILTLMDYMNWKQS